MKTTTVLSGVPVRYGAEELKGGYQRFLLRALILSSFIHFVFWGTWRIRTGQSGGDGCIQPDRRLKPYSENTQWIPRSISDRPLTDFTIRRGGGWAGATADRGIPVPVPGVIAEKWNLDPAAANAGGSADEGIPGGTEAGGEAGLEVEGPPPIFVPIEKEPIVVSRIEPSFPEICRQAGLTGTVTARLWITKRGKVREVVIIQSDSEFFNQVVIEAAKQWIFVPAVMNAGPVDVWQAVVFNFKLR
jgi:TonB family protein